jgi:26 proteasome complex subunit DSS1
MATTSSAAAATSQPTNTKAELGLLEEDDEFEEFETEDWNEVDKDAENDKELNLWEDNWDDDNIEDDFTMQLRYKKNTNRYALI